MLSFGYVTGKWHCGDREILLIMSKCVSGQGEIQTVTSVENTVRLIMGGKKLP